MELLLQLPNLNLLLSMSTPLSAHLVEARRLQNLGFFKDAAKYYALAEAEHSTPQIRLVLEVSGLNIEQGSVGAVLDRLIATTDQIDREHEEPLSLGFFDLLLANVEIVSTVHFSQALEKAVKVFEDHLKGRDPKDYDGRRVCWSCTKCVSIKQANLHDRPFWQQYIMASANSPTLWPSLRTTRHQ